MPDIEIKHLFNHKRLPDSTQKLFSLLIYLPFGVILVALRIVLGLLIFIIGHILPDVQIVRNILSKLLCFTFGIIVNVANQGKKEDVEAFVSNQISIFDHLVVHSATNSVTPGVKLNSLLSSIFGIQNFGSAANFENFKKNIIDMISNNKERLYFQPESTITNGRALIKFNTWPFSICAKVQPITIKVYRPMLGISVTTATATYWTNFFFYLFCPCTIYTLQFLSASEKKGHNDAEFAEKIRKDIATSLKITLVDYSASDLKEWQKRHRFECQQTRSQRSNTTNTVNPEIHRMTIQVREVLPHVPYNVIYRDLVTTKNVDITITNILEGQIVFTPEIPQASSSKSSPVRIPTNETKSALTTATPARDILSTAATTFGKTAQERMLSYQERKKILIENARQRYIEKHGLQNLMLNC